MRRARIAVLALAVLAVGSVFVLGRREPERPYDGPSVVLAVNQAALDAIRSATPMTPTIAARSLYLVHGAVYEAVAAFVDRPVGQLASPIADAASATFPDADLEEVAASAGYQALVSVFGTGDPASVAPFDALLTRFGMSPTAPGLGSPAAVAATLAQQFLLARQDDGANAGNAYRDLRPSDAAADGGLPETTSTAWRPEIVPTGAVLDEHGLAVVDPDDASSYVATQFLTTHWALVDPFALSGPDQFRSPPPAGAEGGPSLADELSALVSLTSTLTEEQRLAAVTWALGPADGFAPVRWNEVAQDISVRDRSGVVDDTLLFFALNAALLDASIAATDTQVAFDLGRPVQLVPTVLGETGWRPWRDPALGSPASPGSISDDAVYAGAAAEVLRQIVGDDALAADTTLPWDRDGDGAADRPGHQVVAPGIDPLTGAPRAGGTLTWATFSEAATQAAAAQQWSGAATATASDAGLAQGRLVGANAVVRAASLWLGQTGAES